MSNNRAAYPAMPLQTTSADQQSMPLLYTTLVEPSPPTRGKVRTKSRRGKNREGPKALQGVQVSFLSSMHTRIGPTVSWAISADPSYPCRATNTLSLDGLLWAGTNVPERQSRTWSELITYYEVVMASNFMLSVSVIATKAMRGPQAM